MSVQNNDESPETVLVNNTSCDHEEKQLSSEDLADVLNELSTRARNVLKRNRISTVEQLLSLSKADLSSFPNAGAKTVHELVHWYSCKIGYSSP